MYCSTGTVPVALRLGMPTEVGCKVVLWIKITANRYSFQAEKNDTTATATMPGADRGSTMCQSAFSSVHPSTTAASSTSLGTVSKTPFKIQMQMGKAKAASTSDSVNRLSSKLSRLY